MSPPRSLLTRSLAPVLTVLLAAVAAPACHGGRDRLPVYSGTIEAVEVDVVPEVSGRIVERPVDQGDRLKQGDVVARIDAQPYANAVAETEAGLAEARARLDLTKSGFRKEEIDAAAREVDEAQAQVTLAEAQVKRSEDLFADQVIAQEQVDQTRRDLDVAVARLASARARLLLLRRGNRPEEIAGAAAEVARLESVLAQRRLDLERTTVRSPLEGTVTEKIQEAGEYARPGSPIVSVADLTHLYVWVYLDTIEKGRVQLGQEVAVKVDAWPDRRFAGTVVYIAPEAEFTPRNVQTPEDRVQLVYGVKVAVPNEDGVLKSGLPADVVLGAAPPARSPS